MNLRLFRGTMTSEGDLVMKHRGLAVLFLAFLLGALCLKGAPALSLDARRARATELVAEDNFKEAWEVFRDLCMAPSPDPAEAVADFTNAVACLRRIPWKLCRTMDEDGDGEADEQGTEERLAAFRDRFLTLRGDDWRVLLAVAQSFYEKGRFKEFQPIDTPDRRRVVALAEKAVRAARDQGGAPAELARVHLEFARMLIKNDGTPLLFPSYRNGCALMRLTVSPDKATATDGYVRWFSRPPVEEDGSPVLFRSPSGLDAAKNDGEKWRWALDQAVRLDPSVQSEVLLHYADFLREQFGVKTLGELVPDGLEGDERWRRLRDREAVLAGLGENETLAELATGEKRFALPDEFNHIAVYRKVAAAEHGPFGEIALSKLARVFEQRRQYASAVQQWKTSIRKYGDPRGIPHSQRAPRTPRGPF